MNNSNGEKESSHTTVEESDKESSHNTVEKTDKESSHNILEKTDQSKKGKDEELVALQYRKRVRSKKAAKFELISSNVYPSCACVRVLQECQHSCGCSRDARTPVLSRTSCYGTPTPARPAERHLLLLRILLGVIFF